MIIVMMGVSGSGKTHTGRLLAEQLRWRFYDADDFHPPENIARMTSGVALTEADREPWLERLRALLREVGAGNAVLACSALSRRFREQLRAGINQIYFVFLKAGPELIAERLHLRQGHFMPASLIESQFVALEEPADALVVDASQAPETIILQVRAALHV
jgi:gluconokinase